MTGDIHRLLKDSGYLDSPTHRFFWKNASPTLRHHLRQVLFLALISVLPIALISATLTLLKGWDRLTLFFFHFLFLSIAFGVMDLVIGVLVRVNALEPFWTENRLLNWLPVPASAIFLLISGHFLGGAVSIRPLETRIPIWIALALSAWIAAGSCKLLFISRLYWHGIRPPQQHYHPKLILLTLMIVGFFQFGQMLAAWHRPELTPVKPDGPVLLLAFDIPENWFDAYFEVFPPWPRQEFQVREPDITNFWTSLGTGVAASHHQAALLSYRTPLFRSDLNQRDATQWLPLRIFTWLGKAEPIAGSERYRKYFWEILDDYDVRTFAFSFWHSFPAASQNGGILSERWSPEHPSSPYSAGLKPLTPSETLSMITPRAARPTIVREKQTWSQLQHLAVSGRFDMAMAYFPLGDLLGGLPPDQRLESQRALLSFRSGRIRRLFESLPREAKIGIFIASGKPTSKENHIQTQILSNWLSQIAHPLQSHLEIAPTLLNYFGLPSDRLMASSRLIVPLNRAAVDYGEPGHVPYNGDISDPQYYEELKSLGYVQ